MATFEPVSDFSQHQAANSLTERLSLLSVQTRHTTDTQRLQFPFPGTSSLIVAECGGVRVGHVDYSLNVFKDRVYINKIEIAPEHHRQGYGLALLWHLWQAHQVPIIPLYEYELSYGFWDKARATFKVAGAEILDQLASQDEMDQESARWQHLVSEPEHERLQRELMASDEWPAIKAKWDAEYGPSKD